ncbi:MAG: serine hydrolase [Pirellula sp.]|nr:serine hydrolase [Pirellula sp.]
MRIATLSAAASILFISLSALLLEAQDELSATKTDSVIPKSTEVPTKKTVLQQTIDIDSVRSAITRTLPLIQRGADGSAEKRECFTCHNQALPIFAMAHAKAKGFEIHEESLHRQTLHTYEHLKRGLENYRKGKGQGGGTLTAGYALWALDEAKWKPDETTQTVAAFLGEFQKEEVRWHHHSGRPPSSDSDFTTTYVALRALDQFASKEMLDVFADRKKQIAVWLNENPGTDTEDFVFRLGAMHYADCSPELTKTAVKNLINLQREDGGWGQLKELESDAYASSTVLFSLLRYGEVAANHEAIQRGISFLLSTQKPDGSWLVKTRAKPFQTYYESGFPHGVDQFISIAASSWAVVALSMTLPDEKPKEQPPVPSSVIYQDLVPISGRIDSGMEPFRTEMSKLMLEHQVPGASLAVARLGKVVFANAFGYADVSTKELVQPESLFRIASISKPITAVAILQLVERGELKLEDRVVDRLRVPFAWATRLDAPVDDRWNQITIENLLQHRGGWDRDHSFDPMFAAARFAKELSIPSPPGSWGTITAMMKTKLDHNPGSKYAYSNFGYCLLGRVIESVTGETYEGYVTRNVLKPIGVQGMRVGHTLLEERLPKEVRYYHAASGSSVFQSNLGESVPSPYGSWHLESMDAHGGWVASATDLAKFGSAFDVPESCPILSPNMIAMMLNRSTPTSETENRRSYSLGWMNVKLANGEFNHWHTGSLPGTSSILIRRNDGLTLVALCNTRESGASGPNNKLAKELDSLLHRSANTIQQWPEMR